MGLKNPSITFSRGALLLKMHPLGRMGQNCQCWRIREIGHKKNPRQHIKPFSVKLWWKLKTRKSLWTKFMLAYYCTHLFLAICPIKPYHSSIWKRMIRVRETTQSTIYYKSGKWKVSLRYD